MQEALVKLASQPVQPVNPTAWLFCAVRNGAISAGRAESRRRLHEAKAVREHDWFQANPDAALDAAEAAGALAELPLEQREIIVAHLWGGLTFEQAADIAGCSASTAHRRYLAGLARLREKLGEPCPIANLNPTTGSKPPCGD